MGKKARCLEFCAFAKFSKTNPKILPQGFVEDARGTLQREIVSYLALSGYVSPQVKGGTHPDV